MKNNPTPLTREQELESIKEIVRIIYMDEDLMGGAIKIQSLVDKAIKRERSRVVEIIEKFADPNPVFLEEHREKIFLKQVVDDLLKAISKLEIDSIK